MASVSTPIASTSSASRRPTNAGRSTRSCRKCCGAKATGRCILASRAREGESMDGIHDLGGMNGFGPIDVERDEPVFHESWEALAFALNSAGIGLLRAYTADEYRHAVERMDPVHYLAARYYERMLTGVATLLVEKGVVTRSELEQRAGGSFPLSRPVAERPTASLSPQPEARFRVGD